MSLSPEERRVMLHALGIPSGDGEPYRNAYHTNDLAPAADVWRSLAKRGLAFEDARKTETDQVSGAVRQIGYPFFWVSAAGMDVLGITPARRTRLEGYELGETS